MRKLIRWIALPSFAVVFALGSAAVLAGSFTGPVEFKAPFEFVVGHKTLPAGAYIIEPDDVSSPAILNLRSADGKTSLTFMTEEALLPAAAVEPEVAFKEVGAKHYLWQVVEGGSTSARELSPGEMGLEAHAAASGTRRAITGRIGHERASTRTRY